MSFHKSPYRLILANPDMLSIEVPGIDSTSDFLPDVVFRNVSQRSDGMRL
jgi:hypothetical protein